MNTQEQDFKVYAMTFEQYAQSIGYDVQSLDEGFIGDVAKKAGEKVAGAVAKLDPKLDQWITSSLGKTQLERAAAGDTDLKGLLDEFKKEGSDLSKFPKAGKLRAKATVIKGKHTQSIGSGGGHTFGAGAK